MTNRRDDQDSQFFTDNIAKLTANRRKIKTDGELAKGWHRNLDPDELDHYTRTTGNTVLLIRHLRRAAVSDAILQPVLATLIADVLEGVTCKATKKRFTTFEPEYLREQVAIAKGMLVQGDKALLALVGLQHPPKTKGELSKLALELAAKHVGLTPRAFKDRLNPSSKRGKRG